MNKFTYGNGECVVQGNVNSIEIIYKGSIAIISKLPSEYTIKTDKNKIMIDFFNKPKLLNELFSYFGEFRVIKVIAYDENKNLINLSIQKYVDYSENLHTNAENITRKSEDIKQTYTYGRYIPKTTVISKVYNNLNTASQLKDLFLKGEIYTGQFHLHIDGTAMTGAIHTKDSKILDIK
tara:strand:+ start:2449 stop:2985 length:537 start_codon:yes stop_codon:yes gene_type:complete